MKKLLLFVPLLVGCAALEAKRDPVTGEVTIAAPEDPEGAAFSTAVNDVVNLGGSLLGLGTSTTGLAAIGSAVLGGWFVNRKRKRQATA